MHLAYPKLYISLRRNFQNGKQYFWLPDWIDRRTPRLQALAVQAGFEMRGGLPWVWSQRSASSAHSARKRSDWQCTPIHNINAAQSETEERMCRRRSWGPTLKGPQCLHTQKECLQNANKIHLSANKGLPDISSYTWVQSHSLLPKQALQFYMLLEFIYEIHLTLSITLILSKSDYSTKIHRKHLCFNFIL